MCNVNILKTNYIKKFTLVASIICAVSSSNFVYADNNYSQGNGEKIVDKRIINNNEEEIFVQSDNQIYIKKLKRKQGHWVMESSEQVFEKWTGLRKKEIKNNGDRKLGESIQKELKKYGLEPDLLPKVVDYSQSEYLPPIGKQYEESCIGWSTGYYLRTYQQARDMGWKVKDDENIINTHVFSPTFIYNQINDGMNQGAAIDVASELLRNTGCATLSQFPYNPGDYYTKPTLSVIQSAYPNRISTWKVLYTDNDSDEYIIQKVREYLNTGDLVVAGSRVGVKFIYPYKDTKSRKSIITSGSELSSLHAYAIVGYDDTLKTLDGKGAFKLVNSWGKEWGDNGFCYISYKAFAQNAVEGYVFTDLANTKEEPLKIEIFDEVTFKIQLSDNGKYNIEIKDKNNSILCERKDIQGQAGINSITWNGKDQTGQAMGDGNYKLNIIPYKDNIPREHFKLSFQKLGRLKNVRGSAYLYENAVQYVNIPITFKYNGILNIKAIYEGKTWDIAKNIAVNAGESKIYRLSNFDFDFKGIDLGKFTILIDIKDK